jgi:hypothetical protein
VKRLPVFVTIVMVALVAPAGALAQGGDFTIFVGGAYPVYDERLTLRPSVPSLPAVDVTVVGTPELRADGGLVFGGALAFELGVFGIEGRLDVTDVAFDLTGARYDLRATAPPLEGVTGSITIGDGRLDVDRLYLLSINARLRTPGPIGVVLSGGLSYLPQIVITGSVLCRRTLAGYRCPCSTRRCSFARLRANPATASGSTAERDCGWVGAGSR